MVVTVVACIHFLNVHIWDPTSYWHKVLSCEREVRNSHDTFVVAIKKSSEVLVMHVFRFLSSFCSILI